MSAERTEYGFRTGPIEVINAFENKGVVSIIVKVGDATIDITSTPKGRRAYVHTKQGNKTSIIVTQVLWSSEDE